MTIQAKRKGIALFTADGLIAATAIQHGLTLVTRNVKDFVGMGVPIFNPWEEMTAFRAFRESQYNWSHRAAMALLMDSCASRRSTFARVSHPREEPTLAKASVRLSLSSCAVEQAHAE